MILLSFESTKTLLENKEDMCDSDLSVSGYELQVNYLNVLEFPHM